MSTLIRTHVMLPKEMVEALDRLVGPRKRSETVAGLVDEWLRREHAKEVFTRLSGFVKAEDHPEWATREDIYNWVREQRRAPNPWDTIRPVLPDGESAEE